ncbi:hypothetical protein SM124_14215 [Bacillus sp. 31A1R]|uniref:Uncharacterized protein n=1 Tax=Robertmurraya mangrovi TaxID=3098077 RepID=A0ABU5J0E9_9BACI|nr:hypothetical protein [Bacillus sp. 31A1R]MDZ5472884.1 hypothetical protein [Bacillus sp. 31A1R]
MKKRMNRIATIFLLLFFMLCIVIDHFPEMNIEMSVGSTGVIFFVLLSIFTQEWGTPIFKSNKQKLKFNVYSGLALITFLVILNALGGISQSGLHLNNPILWFIYFVSVLASYIKYREEIRASKINGV